MVIQLKFLISFDPITFSTDNKMIFELNHQPAATAKNKLLIEFFSAVTVEMPRRCLPSVVLK